MDDLRELVSNFPDPTNCSFCQYTNPKLEKMAKHVALGHSKLDELLQDEDLLSEKQKIAALKPKKNSQHGFLPSRNSIGGSDEEICPICHAKFEDSFSFSDHVSGEHFMDELLEYVSTFDDTSQCPMCTFNSDELEVLGKHLAIDHSKVEELLADEALITSKKMMASINVRYGGHNISSEIIR